MQIIISLEPPDKPTVSVVAGDKKVTLYWDRVAEESLDPTLRVKDFEGYKIYKGTILHLTDAWQITDYSGNKVFYKPIIQYDLINGIKGLFVSSPILYELTSGAPFNLGSDNGIQNFYVDNDVINGRTYYYALVAYDRGEATKDIFPSENTRFISKDALGRISTDINTVSVIPNAPVAGYVPPSSGVELTRTSGVSTRVPYYEVLDPTKVKDTSYTLVFADSIIQQVNISKKYSVKYSGTENFLIQDALMAPNNGVVFNGIRLSIDTTFQSYASIKLMSKSRWSNPLPNDLKYQVSLFPSSTTWTSVRAPNDYLITFSDEYADSSNVLYKIFGTSAPPSKIVNFKVFNITDRNDPKRVQFIFSEAKTYPEEILFHFSIRLPYPMRMELL